MADSDAYTTDTSPVHAKRPPLNYLSDPGVQYARRYDMGGHSSQRQERRYDSSSDEDGDADDDFRGVVPSRRLDPLSHPFVDTYRSAFRNLFAIPIQNPAKNGKENRYTRRTRMRNMKKFRKSLDVPQFSRVSAYCTCDSIALFKLLKWLKRVETGQLPGGEINPNGWKHQMHMGVIHSSCASDDREDDMMTDEMLAIQRKDVFYFATGCTVFWGLSRTEEQAHIEALRAFSTGSVKQVEVEDMDFCYGDASSVFNDLITLSSFHASEKIAISFAMAQSCKLDVFEERVGETIQQTRHIPQTLADTGEITQYSQKDISQLIGRLFMERSDINLNSDMLDDPDFFWDDDEYQPLYKKMMKYLDVDNRVQVLNTRLDVLRELLDVLNEQLARQHDTNLEWIVIWVIVAAVFVKIFWNMLIKDILGLFHH